MDHAIEAVTQTLQAVNRELRGLCQASARIPGPGEYRSSDDGAQIVCGIVWVGDTRVYRKRGQQFDQLTVDHSEHQERLERGDINTILRNDTNIVTRAVGGADRFALVRYGRECSQATDS